MTIDMRTKRLCQTYLLGNLISASTLSVFRCQTKTGKQNFCCKKFICCQIKLAIKMIYSYEKECFLCDVNYFKMDGSVDESFE